MGTPLQGKAGVVGPISDGAAAEVPISKFGGLLASMQGPKFFEWAMAGYLFAANTSPAAPIALPIYSTATNSPTLFNPPDSNRIVVPIRANFGLAAIATYVDDSILCMYTPQAAYPATGATFATFTNVAPTPLLLNGAACRARFAPAVVTWTTQPSQLFNTGVSVWAAGTEANLEYKELSYHFDGTVIMPPGTAISFCGVVATSTTFVTSVIFAELPLPADL